MKQDQLYKVWIVLFVATILIGLVTVWIDTPWIKKGLWGLLIIFSLAASLMIISKPENHGKKQGNVTERKETPKKKSN
ncbi:hypothetical protein [Fictibacillus fluitans]|uniref:Uncharacterized protein n=1 Tax=Fictibacillus fluitans TaxID=3058422 RepID=A0ABT8HYG2_9BACL|nr:hypothetical protein [Fictibacillus sp. NE201]MDN4525821.1 hypothetical protein [Fictibacillus sp. NE201]